MPLKPVPKRAPASVMARLALMAGLTSGPSARFQRLADCLELAIARMNHHVAADDRQAAIGAVQAHMFGAIAVDDHVPDQEPIRVRTLRRLAVAVDQAPARAPLQEIASMPPRTLKPEAPARQPPPR
jgi:hypothetical protein